MQRTKRRAAVENIKESASPKIFSGTATWPEGITRRSRSDIHYLKGYRPPWSAACGRRSDKARRELGKASGQVPRIQLPCESMVLFLAAGEGLGRGSGICKRREKRGRRAVHTAPARHAQERELQAMRDWLRATWACVLICALSDDTMRICFI